MTDADRAALIAQAQGAGGQGAGGGGRQGAAGGGAQANQPPRKDRLMQWMAPFSETSTRVIYEHPARMTGYRFSPDGQILFFQDTSQQGSPQVAMYLNDTATKYVIVRGNAGGGAGGRGADAGRGGGGGGGGQGRGGGGGGNDPVGTLMSSTARVSATSEGSGTPVMLSPDGTSVYLQGSIGGGRGAGAGADPAASPAAGAARPPAVPARPFIDKVAIKTGDRTRMFESQPPAGLTESISTVIGK
jgi:hypothetical protein